jgi:hypothetical protein
MLVGAQELASKPKLSRPQTRRRAHQKFAEFIQWAAEHPHPNWVFRGQGQNWPLKPTIGRFSDRYSASREAQLLDEFKRHAKQYLIHSHSYSEWDWIFVAQHHGLPTRLVDWSTNPLVACFFACQESANGKKSGQITAIAPGRVGYLSNDEIIAGPLNLSKTRFVVPTAVASRIIAQRGLFSVHSDPVTAWRARNQRDFFEIPGELKEEIKALLSRLGIDDQFLMADLDGLTSTLKWRYVKGIPAQ